MKLKNIHVTRFFSFAMKMALIFTGVLLFAAFSGQAQIIKKDPLHFGVTGSVHYSVITGFGGGDGRIAAAVGGFVEIPIQAKEGVNNYQPTLLYIVPQLEFSMLGEGRNGNMPRSQYDYIQIPVYAKFYIKGLNIFQGDRLFAMLGPKIGFVVHQNTASENTIKAALQEKVEDVNLGVSFMAGYALPQHLELFIRADKGFTDIYDGRGDKKANLVALGLGVNWIF